MDPVDMLAVILIGLAIADVVATVILVRAALQHPWAALRDRAGTSAILTLAACLIAALSMAKLADVVVPGLFVTVALIGAMVALSLPQVAWLIAYWRGSFE